MALSRVRAVSLSLLFMASGCGDDTAAVDATRSFDASGLADRDASAPALDAGLTFDAAPMDEVSDGGPTVPPSDAAERDAATPEMSDASEAAADGASSDASRELTDGEPAREAGQVDAETLSDAGGEVDFVIAKGVGWHGRVDTSDAERPRFAWSGSGFEARFEGTGLTVTLENEDAFVFKAVIDGVPQPAFAVSAGRGSRTLAASLPMGVHTVALYRQTEGIMGSSWLLEARAEGGVLRAPGARSGRRVEVVGDSISCGYGNLGASSACQYSYGTESHWDAYAAVAARALDASLSTIAISGYGMQRAFDGADNTLPPFYDRSVASDPAARWQSPFHPQVVLIHLGTNDFALGDPGRAYVSAYGDFVARVRAAHPEALIVCAMGPMLSGEELRRQRAYLQEVADARREAGDLRVALLEFDEQGAADLGCDHHPNAAKHARMGEQLATFLRAQLGW
jgi:lysophospholipase L1-like esterase